MILMMAFICISMFFDFNRVEDNRKELDTYLCQIKFEKISTLAADNILQWFSMDSSERMVNNVVHYFEFIVAVTAFKGLKIRQKMKRQEKQEPTATLKVVFDDVSRLDADESLPKLLMFLVNYGFYKFSIEISLLVFIGAILVRVDILSLLYLIFFVILVFCIREKSERLWKIVTFCIAFSIVLQCILIACYVVMETCLETFNIVDIGKIWSFLFRNLQQIYEHPNQIIADFVLLTVMSCQVKNPIIF